MTESTSTRSPSPDPKRRDAIISVRTQRRTRDLINQAAISEGKTLVEFVLDSARMRAQEVLLDQCQFSLDDEAFDRFLTLIEEPRVPGERLKRLLAEKSPWER